MDKEYLMPIMNRVMELICSSNSYGCLPKIEFYTTHVEVVYSTHCTIRNIVPGGDSLKLYADADMLVICYVFEFQE